MTKKYLWKTFLSILLVSLISKGFSLLSKIALTSSLSLESMTLFGLINPLMVLIITLSSFSLPNVLSCLIASNPKKSKKYFITAFIFVSLFSLILILLILFFGDFIAITLFKNENTIYIIDSFMYFIPIISYSSLIKGYFLGNKETLFTTSSQLFEEGSRLIFNLFIVELLMSSDTSKNASLCVLSLAIGEIFQILFLLLFSNKKYIKRYKKIWIKDNLELKKTGKEMMSLALPMTLSRIVGSLTYCLEPMIIMSILIGNIDRNTLTFNYGILTSYVMPLLLLPGFFSLALSNYLLPHLSSYYENNELQKAKSILKNILLLCSIIGLFFSLFFFFFGGNLLEIFYHTTYGKDEIKILALPFFIYYLETPINITMNALKLSSNAFKVTIISSIVRIILLFILTPRIGVFAVALATLSSCTIDVIINSLLIFRAFKRKKKEMMIF